MNSNPNIILEISIIILTALLTGGVTYWITFNKEHQEKRYSANKDLLEKVYGPIMKIINQSIFSGDGYEGIRESDLIN
ncbi:hypothetical protein LOZ80_39095 [Paenibacillus sp. HWE-109]|uniref:hypothetical protein n=1 Tax=Paenibacillus sp. HWE-109 TaxID=1306526 RepID=UPI001EDFD31C|nr:hypothetical protein [Paenibacillus sp. HWE-109]UKS27374.1 hypothetical protein LOZ80_39095 [Paenibacillus sp. HWE-109]